MADEPKRFGPVALSGTDADAGARLFVTEQALDESPLSTESAAVLQPYENGIHVIEAKQAAFGTDEREAPDGRVEDGTRVFVMAKGQDFGRTGEVIESYGSVHERTYRVDLDGAGEAQVSRDVFLTAEQLPMEEER